tara:strand:+ start:334 stop:642 length:309 start_codon:yes stop_codon:yes gene_type:complete
MYKKIDVTYYDKNLDDIITTVKNIWIDDVTTYENKKGKTLKRQSRKNQIKFLTSLIHSKYYQSRANNKKGVLPSQWNTVFKSVMKMPVDIQAHIIREQEKRI